MKTTKNQNHSQLRTVHQELSKILEEIEMKLQMNTSTIKIRFSKFLASRAPVRILGGLALGALLMTATALPLQNPIYADEPSQPSAKAAPYGFAQEIADLEPSSRPAAKLVRHGFAQEIADLNR